MGSAGEKLANIINDFAELEILKAAADKIAPSLADKNLVEDRNMQVTQKSQEARGAFNTLTGKENDSQEPQQKSDGDAR